MSCRHSLSLLTPITLVSWALPFLQMPALAATGTKPIRPNIVILLADDLGYGDLSSYGHPSITTPALDRLAAEGQRWTNFYAGAPVCSPSRGSLMTGKLPVRSGLYGVKNPVFKPNAKGGIPATDRTLAESLKDVGYDTAIVGKWHLGDKPEALPTRRGFDSWLGTPYSNDQDWWIARGPITWDWPASPPTDDERAMAREFLEALADENRRSSDWKTALISSDKSSPEYRDVVVERPANQEILTKRYTEKAVSFIRSHAGGHRPFFLYVAYNMPHLPTFASESFKGTSLGGTYGDVVQEIDWSAKEIRRALEETGLARNTVLVFSSDNGAAPAHVGSTGLPTGSTGPLKGRKGTTFEGGVRSPAIFWWPGHVKPAIVHGIGSLMDLYATSLSLAGVKDIPNDIDSIDLTPALVGKPSPRSTLEYFSIRGQLLGYRNGPWKVSFTEDGSAPSNKVELYNLDRDPSELRDLSQTNPDILETLINEAKVRDAQIPRAEPIFDQD